MRKFLARQQRSLFWLLLSCGIVSSAISSPASDVLVRFEKDEINLGNVIRTPLPMVIPLRYINQTQEIQEINGSAISCGCSFYNVEKKKLNPKESSIANVTINRLDDSGAFQITLALDVKNQKNPSRCTIVGNLIDAIKFNPLILTLPPGDAGTVDLYLAPGWNVSQIQYDDSALKVDRSIGESPGRERWQVRISNDAPVKNGIKIMLKDASGQNLECEFLVNSKSMREVSFFPDPIILKAPHQSREVSVTLKSNIKLSKNVTFACDMPAVTIQEPRFKDGGTELKFVLNRANSNQKISKGTLYITDNDLAAELPIFLSW